MTINRVNRVILGDSKDRSILKGVTAIYAIYAISKRRGIASTTTNRKESRMTDTTDTTDAADLGELRALWALESSKRADANTQIAPLYEELRAPGHQQAAERAVAAALSRRCQRPTRPTRETHPDTRGSQRGGRDRNPHPEQAPEDGEPPKPLCNSAHPTDRHSSCKRFAGHDGDHAAHTFRISAEAWPAVPVPVDLDGGDPPR